MSNRIVNIDRHYLRLIIRGKETKFVEFGVKVNNIRIDGASFSFKAFSKGVRLKDWFICNNNWSRLELRRLQRIQSMLIMPTGNFVLNIYRYSREGAIRLEGSLGTQKQHYSLARIKARNRKTEMLWIFFGIHTANAVFMIEKIEKKKEQQHNRTKIRGKEERF